MCVDIKGPAQVVGNASDGNGCTGCLLIVAEKTDIRLDFPSWPEAGEQATCILIGAVSCYLYAPWYPDAHTDDTLQDETDCFLQDG